jgi:signal transduction histidine kinase
VLKHAGPRASARVLVRYGHDQVEVEVADDGSGDADAEGGGHGLLGMRERVTVFGGAFESGPRPDGGFAVRAYLPL